MRNQLMQIWQQKWLMLFWMMLGLATFLLLIELAPEPQKIPYLDKLEHATGFAVLYILGKQAYKPHAYWLAGALILYGGLIESLQGFLTVTRQASVYDWLADIVGVLVAILIINNLQKMKSQLD